MNYDDFGLFFPPKILCINHTPFIYCQMVKLFQKKMLPMISISYNHNLNNQHQFILTMNFMRHKTLFKKNSNAVGGQLISMNDLFREKNSNIMTNVEKARILSLVLIIKSFILSRSRHRSFTLLCFAIYICLGSMMMFASYFTMGKNLWVWSIIPKMWGQTWISPCCRPLFPRNTINLWMVLF